MSELDHFHRHGDGLNEVRRRCHSFVQKLIAKELVFPHRETVTVRHIQNVTGGVGNDHF